MSKYKHVTLAEVCLIKPPKKEAKEKLSESDLVSFVPMKNLGICSKKILLDEDRALNKVTGSYTYFADGDVLLAKITPCFENGKLGIARGLTNGVGFGSSEYLVFRSKGEVVPEYLFYFFSQETFRKNGAKVMTGAVGHKRVPKEYLANYPLFIPPLPEQKRIVSILDEAFAGIDKAIANTKKNLVNAHDIYVSVKEELFANIEKINTIQFGEIIDILTDYHANGSYAVLKKNVELKDTEDYAWMVRSTDFEKNFRNQKRYISESAYNYLSKSTIYGGEIIMSKIGNAGNTYLMPEISRPCSLAMNLFLIRLRNNKANNHYIYHYLQTKSGDAQIRSKLKGAATQTITKESVRSLLIPLPSMKTQQEVVEKIKDIEPEISNLESIYQQKLKALHELKQSILQKAFTGELTTDINQ